MEICIISTNYLVQSKNPNQTHQYSRSKEKQLQQCMFFWPQTLENDPKFTFSWDSCYTNQTKQVKYSTTWRNTYLTRKHIRSEIVQSLKRKENNYARWRKYLHYNTTETKGHFCCPWTGWLVFPWTKRIWSRCEPQLLIGLGWTLKLKWCFLQWEETSRPTVLCYTCQVCVRQREKNGELLRKSYYACTEQQAQVCVHTHSHTQEVPLSSGYTAQNRDKNLFKVSATTFYRNNRCTEKKCTVHDVHKNNRGITLLLCLMWEAWKISCLRRLLEITSQEQVYLPLFNCCGGQRKPDELILCVSVWVGFSPDQW